MDQSGQVHDFISPLTASALLHSRVLNPTSPARRSGTETWTTLNQLCDLPKTAGHRRKYGPPLAIMAVVLVLIIAAGTATFAAIQSKEQSANLQRRGELQIILTRLANQVEQATPNELESFMVLNTTWLKKNPRYRYNLEGAVDAIKSMQRYSRLYYAAQDIGRKPHQRDLRAPEEYDRLMGEEHQLAVGYLVWVIDQL